VDGASHAQKHVAVCSISYCCVHVCERERARKTPRAGSKDQTALEIACVCVCVCMQCVCVLVVCVCACSVCVCPGAGELRCEASLSDSRSHTFSDEFVVFAALFPLPSLAFVLTYSHTRALSLLRSQTCNKFIQSRA